jgi:PAS domain S-box-containing protein
MSEGIAPEKELRKFNHFLDNSQILASREEHFKAIISSLPVVLFSLDPDGRFIFSDGQGLEEIGLKPQEVVGVHFREFFSQNPEIIKKMERALTGESFISKDEFKGINFETRYIAVLDADGRVIRVNGIAFNLAEKLKTEKQIAEQQELLIQSSKMTALGQMASGISHEINNPLTIIYGSACKLAAMAQKGDLTPEAVEATAKKIEKTTRRIEKIIDGLRAFSRDSAHDSFEKVSLKQIVEDTLSFCHERLKLHCIDLIVAPMDESHILECRPVQVSEVLLNLLNNAHDAAMEMKEKWIKISTTELGDYLELSVEDSGIGIEKGLEGRIFDPFFTTKKIGLGTGLGLSIAKGLVEAHGGNIFLDAKSPATRFVIRLPKKQSV